MPDENVDLGFGKGGEVREEGFGGGNEGGASRGVKEGGGREVVEERIGGRGARRAEAGKRGV